MAKIPYRNAPVRLLFLLLLGVVKIKTIEMNDPNFPKPESFILFALKSGKLIVVSFNFVWFIVTL